MDSILPSKPIYKPLDQAQSQIRLITLFPGNETEIVSCKLEYVSLHTAPAYYALSYRWGNPTERVGILLDGIYVNVTRNLEAAFRCLRNYGHHRIWADAVCINQEDLEERARQVSMMTSIYQSATEVDAWISDGSSGTEKAVVLLCSLTLPSLDEECKELLETLSKHEAFDNWMAIRAFFETPFWRRVWIIQEVTCGRPVNIISGHRNISWDQLQSAISTIEEKSKVPSSIFSPSFPSVVNVKALQKLRIDRAEGRPVYLLDALYNTRLALATDPLDNVFALLGLSCDSDKYVPNLRYNQNVEELSISMFQSIVGSTSSLDWLILAERDDMQFVADKLDWNQVPSFVPVWSNLGGQKTRQRMDYLAGQDYKMEFKSYKTTLNSAPEVKYVGKTLSAVGICIDNIDGLCVSPAQSSENVSRTGSAVQSSYSSNPYGNTKHCVEALHRTLSLEKPASLPISRQIGGLNGSDAFKVFGYGINSPRIVSRWLALTSAAMARRPFPKKRPTQFGLKWNRFMTTQNGYVGWAPCEAESGDSIYLLLGCSMPIVLRPTTDETRDGFLFVGPAYVQGIMGGEYMDRADKKDWKPITII